MCNQCEVLVINGIKCHETGCPEVYKDEIGDLSCFVQIKATGRKFATLDEFIKKHKSI